MYDVISFGTATLDVFLRSSELEVEGRDGKKDICVSYGAKLEVNEINFESGGGGTNSVVTFARQGLKAAPVVQIGDDLAGQKILEDLAKEQIPTDFINVQKSNYTDYSTILWASDGGRTILVYRGKTKLEVENVPWDKLEAQWAYVSSLEGNLEIIKNLKSRANNLKIFWNPGGRELKQRDEVLSLLSGITLLNLNKEEMEELLAIDGQSEAEELLAKAQKLPCDYIAITDDRRGAFLWDKANAVWWKSGIFEDSPRYETTGAGDAFGSGLATGIIKGLSLDNSLYLAAANASSVVSFVGAKKGILNPTDLSSWPREKLNITKVAS